MKNYTYIMMFGMRMDMNMPVVCHAFFPVAAYSMSAKKPLKLA